jgi:putative hemolysin
MELPVAVSVFVLSALMGLAFFCSLAETALFSLGRLRIRQWKNSGGPAGLAARLLDRPDDVLSALSLANVMANGMLAVTSLILASSLGWNRWLTLGGAFVLHLFVGEIAPKTLAARSPERWATRVASAVALLQSVTQPFRSLAQGAVEWLFHRVMPAAKPPAPITDEEYRELLDMAVQQGTLGASEREIIAQQARDVMRPRATMAAVPDDLSIDELVREARRFRHRRLPVYDETPDTIVGVLNAQQFLLHPEGGLEEAIEFPSFVPETMNLLQLFQALQRQRRSLAIALDEFGAVAGVVRMEDILAEVLGEMSNDGGPRGFIFERLGPGRWRASGFMRLEDFRREYPALPPTGDVETLGGLLMSQLDIVPARGDSAVTHGLRLTATVVDERRVRELLVERIGTR